MTREFTAEEAEIVIQSNVQRPRSRDGGKGRIKDYGVWIKGKGIKAV